MFRTFTHGTHICNLFPKEGKNKEKYLEGLSNVIMIFKLHTQKLREESKVYLFMVYINMSVRVKDGRHFESLSRHTFYYVYFSLYDYYIKKSDND